MNQSNLSTAQPNYPLLGDRVQSTFIDGIFIIVLMFAFSTILDKYENAPDSVRIAMFIAIWLVYDPLCTSLGCTLGNYIKGLRVRQFTDNTKRINFFQAIIRYIIKFFLGWISFLTINSNREKRAIHDFAVGSVVVRNETVAQLSTCFNNNLNWQRMAKIGSQRNLYLFCISPVSGQCFFRYSSPCNFSYPFR